MNNHRRCCCGNACCTGGRHCILATDAPSDFTVSGSSTLTHHVNAFGTPQSHATSIPGSSSIDTGWIDEEDHCEGVSSEIEATPGAGNWTMLEDDSFTVGTVTKERRTGVRIVHTPTGLLIKVLQTVYVYDSAVGHTFTEQANLGFQVSIVFSDDGEPCAVGPIAHFGFGPHEDLFLSTPEGQLIGGPEIPVVSVTPAGRCAASVRIQARFTRYGDDTFDSYSTVLSDLTVTVPSPSSCGAVGEDGCLGACCVEGECEQLTPEDCEAAGGQFLGQGRDCGRTPCQPAEPPPDCCDTDCCFNLTTVGIDYGVEVDIVYTRCCANVVTACPGVHYEGFWSDSVVPGGDCAPAFTSHSIPSIQVETNTCCLASPATTFLNSNSIDANFRCLDGFEYGGLDAPQASVRVSMASFLLAAYAGSCNFVEDERTYEFNDEICNGTHYKAFLVTVYMWAYAFGRGDCEYELGRALGASERAEVLGKEREDVQLRNGDRPDVGERGRSGGGAADRDAERGASGVRARTHPAAGAEASPRRSRPGLHQVLLGLVGRRRRRAGLVAGGPG